MKKIFTLALIAVCLATVSRITPTRLNWIPAAVADTLDLNPNGSSELALLMRSMVLHAETEKKNIADRKPKSVYPKEFEKIYTAVPTNDHMKNEYFDQFADLYLSALKTYHRSSSKDRSENYRNLISACVARHTSHCPGPMVKIKKLGLDEK